MLEAQQEERRRIAESLHNGVGQILFATKLQMARVEVTALPGQPSEASQALEKTRRLLTEAINETRNVSHELVPLLLKDFGLAKAIEEFCSRFQGTGIQLQCHCLPERLAAPLEMTMYRISQELVTNIIRHSGATRGRLEVYRDKDYVYIESQDNGIGITTAKDKNRTRQDSGKGIGLKYHQGPGSPAGRHPGDRCYPHKGTLISIRLPLAAAHR